MVPTLPHEVIIANVVYPAIFLAHGKSISFLPAMVVGIQSGFWVLTKSLCQVEVVLDPQGKPAMDSEGRSEVKTPNSRIKLPYTYLMAWYVMHCPLLMTAASASEGFVPFVQRLESSNVSQYYMFYVQKAILSRASYQLDRCFSEIHNTSYGKRLPTLQAQMSSRGYSPESSGGLSTSDLDTYLSARRFMHDRTLCAQPFC